MHNTFYILSFIHLPRFVLRKQVEATPSLALTLSLGINFIRSFNVSKAVTFPAKSMCASECVGSIISVVNISDGWEGGGSLPIHIQFAPSPPHR